MKQAKGIGKQLMCNRSAEFLIFTGQAGEQSIEARYEDEAIWLSQKLMAALFAVDVRTVSEHLKNIFASGELDEDSVVRKFRITESDGMSYATNHYNLDAIISLGYRGNPVRATRFRQGTTQVLREFAVKCYVLDKKRMGNGSLISSIPGLGIEPASDAISIQFVSALHKVSSFVANLSPSSGTGNQRRIYLLWSGWREI